MSTVIWFTDEDAVTPSLVGGKGANLGRLSRAGFAVPAGFVVTTEAYSDFLRDTGIGEQINLLLEGIRYDDPDRLEQVSRQIRDVIVGAELSADLASVITEAYSAGEPDRYVAVRSSGIAEDLAEASFAGQHDTYLDIRGTAELLGAVRRCWASLWTARATSYRHTNHIDHGSAPIAVIVQDMVESEVSGVMFTANPMTSATDEIVVNAGWGLGEAVVSGIITPDEYILEAGTLRVKRQTIGSKSVRIVRDADLGSGTVSEEISPVDQQKPTMSVEQVAALAAIGWRVQEHYDGFPQDIEWALLEGEFYVLQSRPITGVEFSWDEIVCHIIEEDDSPDYLWSREMADQIWTGAISPLMFSYRALTWQLGHRHAMEVWGLDELVAVPLWKFRKAEGYFNTRVDELMTSRTIPPPLRPGMMSFLPTHRHEAILKAPFSYLDYAKKHLRIQILTPDEGLYRWFKTLSEDYHIAQADAFKGLPDEQLVTMSDQTLSRYVDGQVQLEVDYNKAAWTGYYFFYPDIANLLTYQLQNWYDGDIPAVGMELITGTEKRTPTAIESRALWVLAERIRSSPSLSECLERCTEGEYFAQLQDCEAGPEFLAEYRDSLVHPAAHRGHQDRDLAYSRRSEDPSIDERALRAILAGGALPDPETREDEVNKRRKAVYAEVVENIRQRPLGSLKAEAFKLTYDYIHKFLVLREEERNHIDLVTFSIRKGCLEVARRLVSRGLLNSEREVFFLTLKEMHDLLATGHVTPLLPAKIKGRMRDFDRFNAREIKPPKYIQDGRTFDDDPEEMSADGVLRGNGTSRGTVTGTARVVGALKDIGRIRSGEILVCNSTDPGWTPVFLLIKGIVLETGGMLAHGSLLAREFGFAAVQINNAMTLIPDGATITVDGDNGTVTIHDDQDEEVGEPDRAGSVSCEG